MNVFSPEGEPVWLDAEACSISDFRNHVARTTRPADVPLASAISANIPVYDAAQLRQHLDDAAVVRAHMTEWHQVFLTGPGIVVFKGAYDDLELIDAVTRTLNAIIADEKRSAPKGGDHFGMAGANTRLWNAHEKLCLADAGLFARYNANPIVPLVSRAWLGPHYQITTQVNIVHPGGKAQVCHRDYHMGFQTPEELSAYPAHVHWLSAALTLQGAVAHTGMPLETGPTKLLPYSQTYKPGYFAAQLPAFREYFEQHHAQVPLAKGDAMFFNPAVFHAAGHNRTADQHRFGNLMQIGSGYGRSIEIVDRARMSNNLYPALLAMKAGLSARELNDVVAACAEGYPFPANLDIDSPLSGMAPESQQGLMRRALGENWPVERFRAALNEQSARKRSH